MFRHFLPGIVWALVILILCGIPGRDIPHISFLELLSFDKFVHAAIFFVLYILFRRSLNNAGIALTTERRFILFFSCIIYGGLLEIMQGLVFEERSADLYDFIANSFGVIVANFVVRKAGRA